MAENATHNLHNVLTLRGALVRDPHVWASYLDEAIELFGERSRRRVRPAPLAALGPRADRRLPRQAARPLRLHPRPDAAAAQQGARRRARSPSSSSCRRASRSEWHCRGYYGSLSHNVKAVYQRYLGWFDGNPAHLWPHPPEAAATRYVELAGGADALLAHARAAFARGDFRWVAEVVNHLVFADPENAEARELQARAFEQLAYGAENAHLAQLLPDGRARAARRASAGTAAATDAPGLHPQPRPHSQLFDVVAIRIDGPRAGDRRIDARAGASPTPGETTRSRSRTAS